MQIKKVQLKKDFKEVQQDVTELNGDGNRDRGRYGEDLTTSKKIVDEQGYDEDGVLHDKCGTDECCNSCETSDDEELGFDPNDSGC